jgi:cobalamin biosynthesis protein CobD/CbiB
LASAAAVARLLGRAQHGPQLQTPVIDADVHIARRALSAHAQRDRADARPHELRRHRVEWIAHRYRLRTTLFRA